MKVGRYRATRWGLVLEEVRAAPTTSSLRRRVHAGSVEYDDFHDWSGNPRQDTTNWTGVEKVRREYGVYESSRADRRVHFKARWYDATRSISDFKTSRHYLAGMSPCICRR